MFFYLPELAMSTQPVRPPRMSKSPKESQSGLLMSVIRTLSASQSNKQRDDEKSKLEKNYKHSDQRLHDLVTEYKDDLTVTMQKSSKISARIMTCKEKVHSVKEKLIICKKLLHCKRDELKKLWLEAVEHKHVLNMLSEIEGLVGVPEKLEDFMNKKHYLHATQLLVTSISLLEGSLEGVDALKDLKNELYTKREHLHDVLVEELHKQLYVRSTSNILFNFKRQGSERRSDGLPSTPKKSSSRLDMSTPSPQSHAKFGLEYNKSPPGSETNIKTDQDVLFEDITSRDPEENTQHYIAILVECVALLNRVPETVEVMKERCRRELLAIVRRTAQHVSDNTQNFSVSYIPQPTILGVIQNPEQQYLLSELLELTFEQFQCVAQGHQCVLNNLKRAMAARGENEEQHLYEMADIWSKIQAVLEILIGEYLDIHNTATSQQPAPPAFTEVPATTDISSYFLRKRNNIRPKKFALFRFDSSSHALSMKTYLQEQKDALKEKGEIDSIDAEQQILVCQPTARNITIVFKPLMKFICEIEQDPNLENGNYCPLHTFLTECVKVFLGQVNLEVSNIIDNATKNFDSSKSISDADILQSVGASTPLLQSTMNVDDSLKQLQEFIHALPIYSNHFLHIILSMLQNYKEACQGVYRAVMQPETEEKNTISFSLAKKHSQLLRSLPNWTNLQVKDNHDFEESPEEVRLRNKKESEILIEEIARENLIQQHEILSDLSQLRTLAQLQESMEWFASRISAFADSLPKQQSGLAPPSQIKNKDDISPVPEAMIESLMKLSKEFEDLADTCLLVLHLEVRVHCFFYLLPVAVQGSYASRMDSQEPDPEVVKLNKDLSSIDEAMAMNLQPRKIKYIFEGLGELISTILVNCTSNIKRINENGVKKMCRNIFAIQQNLTSITMSREVALDRARQYFELFNHGAEEILNMIVENGPQFQELEYITALHLLHRSKPGSDPKTLNHNLDRLQEILNEVAVSV